MGLTGSFRGLSITEMLQLIRMSKKTGALRITLVDNTRHTIYFRAGQVIGVECGRDSLIPFLLERGLLSNDDLNAAISQQKSFSRKTPLEQILLDSGAVTRNDLVEALTSHAEETIGALIQERSGTISFEDGAEPQLKLEIALDIHNLLMAASVKADEALRDRTLPYVPTDVYAHSSEGRTAFAEKTMRLWVDHWRVFLAIDGNRTLRAISEKIQVAPDELMKGIAALLTLGYIEPAAGGSARRIALVVDESAMVQKLVQMALAEEDIEIESVSDADSAHRVLAERTPDVILINVALPPTSGYRLCRQLRGPDSPCNSVPVILLSARDTPQDEKLAIHAGATAFVSLPFTPESLRNTVRSVLS
ncbi:MAG: Phosphate regulon transcriptional regulatory protein PhoB [Candidatus Latescibacteria bacterium ADurb.Bin168]|nr:MAG: Phosphate regulon transcriptional regulatory protein PhoB [Candidatus Latescibacteria bacterium ADurb.Bin168]